MAKRYTSFSAGVQVPSATLNGMQDQTMSILLANGSAGNNFIVPLGSDGILWQSGAVLTTSGGTQIANVDGNDWHDRLVWGWCVQNTSAASGEGGGSVGTSRVGQGLDYNLDFVHIAALGSGAATKPYFFWGYLGKGGWSSTSGSGTAVSAGNPPTRGTSGVTSWFVNLSSSDGGLCLFVDPSTYKLYLYNNTSSTIQPTIRLQFTAATGLRP